MDIPCQFGRVQGSTELSSEYPKNAPIDQNINNYYKSNTSPTFTGINVWMAEVLGFTSKISPFRLAISILNPNELDSRSRKNAYPWYGLLITVKISGFTAYARLGNDCLNVTITKFSTESGYHIYCDGSEMQKISILDPNTKITTDYAFPVNKWIFNQYSKNLTRYNTRSKSWEQVDVDTFVTSNLFEIGNADGLVSIDQTFSPAFQRIKAKDINHIGMLISHQLITDNRRTN
jgi:hypothetical protein